MTFEELPIRERAKIKLACLKYNITSPEDINTVYNNYLEGRSIFDGLSDSYQRASAFSNFLANGGHIYSGTEEKTQQMQVGALERLKRRGVQPRTSKPMYEEASYMAKQDAIRNYNNEVAKEAFLKEMSKNMHPYRVDSKGAVFKEASKEPIVDTPERREAIAQTLKAEEDAKFAEQAEKAWDTAKGFGLMSGAILGSVYGGPYVAAALRNPYVDAALTSVAGADAAHSISNGTADAVTALELMPLFKPAKAVGEAALPTLKTVAKNADEVATLMSSPYTGRWATFGNKQYRFSPNTLGMNFTPIESRSAPALSPKMKELGWKLEDGFAINPKDPKKKFVWNGKGWISEASLKEKNESEALVESFKQRDIAKAKEQEEATKSTLSELKSMGFGEFAPRKWFQGRDWMKNTPGAVTKEDVATWNSHLPEYLDLAKDLKGKSLYFDSKKKKWIGKFANGEMEVVPEEYIVAHSKAFNDAGLHYDGHNWRSAMSMEKYNKLLDNGGIGITNWTTDGNKQITVFQSEGRPKIVSGIVSSEKDPPVQIPTKYAREKHDVPTGLEFSPNVPYRGTTGNFKLFGQDIQIKALRGNNGNFDMSNFNPFKSLLIPIVTGSIGYSTLKNNNNTEME